MLNLMNIKKILLQWPRYFWIKIFRKQNEKQSNCAATPNEQLPDEFHITIIGKVKKHEMHTSFMRKIWSTGLLHMQLKSKYRKGIRLLLKFIDV